MRHEVTTRRVLYEIPGMRSVRVREDAFAGADGQPLAMAIYDPPAPLADPSPVVVLIAGYPDAGFEKHLGCKFMEMEWAISMAQLIAMSGMTAITHTNRDPIGDAAALMNHLAAGGRRVGIWATSGHSPVALAVADQAACTVLINPMTSDVLPETPLLIVRSGKDETPGLNAALDNLLARSIVENRPVSLVNYPDAPHAFDLHLDNPETRRILQQGLDFLRAYLR
jgi:dienelactone hydrolase